MALAKFYEDILERLYEENEKLSEYMFPENIPSKNYVEHVKKHLESSRGFLDELLELLTNPGSGDLFFTAEKSKLIKQRIELIKQRDELLNKISLKEFEIRRMKELNDSLNSECGQLQRKVNKLESDNKEISRLLKKKNN